MTSLLARPDALLHLLHAYASEFPEAGDISASIEHGGDATFRYDNEDGDATEVRELYRGIVSEAAEIVVLSRGRRSFGEFEALIHVVAWRDGTRTAYRVEVKAYPEHALLRFVARDLGFGQRFFRSKTREVCRLAERVVPAAARAAAGHVALAIGPR
ncbi:MAG: hypothetical protein AB1625_02525 [Acidobacteriota bacterium]